MVKSTPYTPPLENEVVVKNGAVVINLFDYAKMDMGELLFYPFVLGLDVAGEIVVVGPGITRLKVGDRVVG